MTLENVVGFLANTGKTKLAIEVADHFSSHSRDLNNYVELAKAYLSIHEYDKAIEACKKSLLMVFDPDRRKEILSNMSRIYFLANMQEEALGILSDLPQTPDVLIMKSDALKSMEHKMGVSATGYWNSKLSEMHIFCEDLAEWMSGYLDKGRTIHDFGCGVGYYLTFLEGKGFVDLIGYEGEVPEGGFPNILKQDLSDSFAVENKGDVICLEVGEHIPKQYMNAFLDNICGACDGKLILSWAARGHYSSSHVNCLNNDEVIPEIEKRGFRYLRDDSEKARKAISLDGCNWFRDTILIHEKLQKRIRGTEGRLDGTRLDG